MGARERNMGRSGYSMVYDARYCGKQHRRRLSARGWAWLKGEGG